MPGSEGRVIISLIYMKISPSVPERKHGLKARAARDPRAKLEDRLHVRYESDFGQAIPGPRLKTVLSFEAGCQAYLWTTDRGRSRLIKH